MRLPVREYPDIDPPVVTITTVYPGANSKVIESEITDLIEEELNGIEGIRTMSSTSRDQVSSIVVEFDLNRKIDIAAQDVRDKISRIRAKLPENTEEPIIAKADADAQPIMWIMVKSEKRSLIELSEFVDREIKDSLQTVKGVSKVIFGGERRRSVQILLNPKQLAYYGLTVLDVESALQKNNIELPAGRVMSKNKEFSINVDAKLTDEEQYKKLIIKSNSARIIRLEDIANIRIGAENDQSFVRFNGQQGFGLGIIRQSKANTIEISDLVHKKLGELKKTLPDDIDLSIGFDAAVFIRLSLEELYWTILQATALVLLIMFAFLRNISSTLIPAVSIPISLIGVMGGVFALGFTVNLMTLLGLIIAIGIVVDDSIIVLENIYRYVEEGMDPREAAKKGAEEITLAVIATTLVLVAIFLPVGFMTGITGRLLSEFAFSLCISVIISAFVALTMAPMLCSKVLKIPQEEKGFIKWLNDVFRAAETVYSKVINKVIKFKGKVTLFTFVLCIPLIVLLYNFNTKDFIPKEDRGVFFTIVQTQRGSNVDYLDRQIRKVENILITIPEIKTVIAVAAFGLDAPGKVTSGILVNRLVDWKDRSGNVKSIVGPLYETFSKIPEAFILPILPNSGPDSGFGSQPIQLVIKSNDLDFLVRASAAITQKSFTLPSIAFARSNLTLDKPEISVEIDRDKALSLGVPVGDIARSLEILFAGVDVTEFNDHGDNYQVIVKVPREEISSPYKIGEIGVKSTNGTLVQLSNLIRLSETVGAEERNHYNRKKAVSIGATPKPGVSPAEGLADLEGLARKVIKDMDAESIAEIDFAGTSKELKDSNITIMIGFLIALAFAYLFLAGQFESFSSPFIIMLTVPLAVLGALIGLACFKLFPVCTEIAISHFGAPAFIKFIIPQFDNISINIYSQIGIIMLIGMASKNGILMVEFMNQLRAQGMALEEAVTKAAVLRLRPILMTTFSTVLGILPIALALGVGSESRQSLGIVLVTGMLFSTLLTLFVVPCAYALVNKNS